MIGLKTMEMAAARLWLCGAKMEDLRLLSGRDDIEAVVRSAVVDAAEADGDEAAPAPMMIRLSDTVAYDVTCRTAGIDLAERVDMGTRFGLVVDGRAYAADFKRLHVEILPKADEAVPAPPVAQGVDMFGVGADRERLITSVADQVRPYMRGKVARPGKQRKAVAPAAPPAPAGDYSQYPAKLRAPQAKVQRIAYDLLLDEPALELAELVRRAEALGLNIEGDREQAINSALYELKSKGLAERVGTRPATWRRA